jgi:hypothetical protein
VYDAYAVRTGAGPVLIDPEVAAPGDWRCLLALMGQRPVATALTSAWHERAAYRLRDAHGIPVWAPAAGAAELEGRPDHLYGDGTALPGGLRAVGIDARYAGDTVLRWTAPGGPGVLFTGDVVLEQLNPEDPRADHWRRAPGLYLWLHGTGGRARFRAAFGRLLDEDFALVCSAHSVVLRDAPKAALARALATGRVAERPMERGTAVALIPA